MCTTILIGKNASYDGSTMVARIEDSSSGMFKAKKFIYVSSEDQVVDYKSVRTDCEIKLPEKSFSYTCLPNVKKWRGVWGACGINEKNVSMTATETITTNERVLGADPLVEYEEGIIKKGGIGEEDFIVIVLPYISSAREGVERLGKLLEEYGTYESNAVAFQDENEIWWLESIGGHHWIAKKVPDDAYVVMPNQLGIDEFDFKDAFSKKESHMCSEDLREFIKENHLDLSLKGNFNPREAFGSDSYEDHVYNTPRAWVMLRYFNKNTYSFDGPDAEFKPSSNNLPWSMVPEGKITIEDVKTILSNHYEGTPYDPYGRHGQGDQRGKFRPIGINRDDVLALTQIRPYVDEEIKAIEWLAFGSNVFNGLIPFYTNISKTPKYLANTSLTPTSENFYWVNRIIGVLCDSNFAETQASTEAYQMKVLSKGHEIINKYDKEFKKNKGSIKDIKKFLEKANEEVADFTKEATDKYLDEVLYIASLYMKNSFSRSDA
ncbi:C69 family dipeptidase [Peptoniphilus raoultii]|uniref:C69 family dipeptidase n=1 Tax=Peptoniphilus raoultii TaxID=1776387 RepID=UPI0008DA0C77|nr:C69 family dipeptidase [Peptoniphilus raoultii]